MSDSMFRPTSTKIVRSKLARNHSPPSIADVKNEWSYKSTPQ